ncbi:hypothetical protein CsSME_00029452 [Camellia sinensis var. sinensis]
MARESKKKTNFLLVEQDLGVHGVGEQTLFKHDENGNRFHGERERPRIWENEDGAGEHITVPG